MKNILGYSTLAARFTRPCAWAFTVWMAGSMCLAGAWTEESVAKTAVRPKVGFFRDKNGVLMITNRVEKYQRHADYSQIKIQYERVQIPDRYRKLDYAGRHAPAAIENLVTQYARKYGIEESLVYAVIKVESNFQSDAQSPKGACGLMQLMPGTAADMGVTDIFDPAQNIAGGTQYLSKLLALFAADRKKALAAYNAGPSVVKRYNDVPPFPETQGYVHDVLAWIPKFTAHDTRRMHLAKLVDTPGSAASAKPLAGRSPAQLLVPPAVPKTDTKYYTIRFFSGLTQPAEEISDEGDLYCVRFGNREYLVPKEHVKEVTPPE